MFENFFVYVFQKTLQMLHGIFFDGAYVSFLPFLILGNSQKTQEDMSG